MRITLRRAAATMGAGCFAFLLAAPPAGAGASTAPTLPSNALISEVGSTYHVTQNVLLSVPDPTNEAISTLLDVERKAHTSFGSGERAWDNAADTNGVEDVVARTNSPAQAAAYISDLRRAIAGEKIVAQIPLPSIPGAYRSDYFATRGPEVGVGQSIILHSGPYVAALTFFSAETTPATPPITPADAQGIATAQYQALTYLTHNPPPAPAGTTSSAKGWYVLLIAMAAALLLLVLLVLPPLRRRVRAAKVASVAFVPPAAAPTTPPPADHSTPEDDEPESEAAVESNWSAEEPAAVAEKAPTASTAESAAAPAPDPVTSLVQSATPVQAGRATSCLGYLFPAALVALAVLWVLRKRSARAAG